MVAGFSKSYKLALFTKLLQLEMQSKLSISFDR